MPKNGFFKFHIHMFKGLETALAESVLEDLVEKLIQVKDLKVEYMDELPNNEVRSQFVQFVSMIIE